MKTKQFHRSLPEIMLGAIIILVLFVFFLGKAKSGMAEAHRVACLGNVHQLAQAIQMYSMDQGAYPLGPRWHELVTIDVVGVGVLACPQRPEDLGYGYGMNYFVAGLADNRLAQPADTILLADVRNSTADTWWVNDLRFQRLVRNRVPQDCHLQKAAFGFCDGHVKTINHLDLTEQQWRPQTVGPN